MDAILKAVESALSIRDKAGLVTKKVWVVHRIWSSGEVGHGDYKDILIDVTPTPVIKDMTQDMRIVQGGVYQAGDFRLTSIPKSRYSQHDLDPKVSENEEILYKVGDDLCQLVSIKENYATWDIHVRRIKSQPLQVWD